MAASPAEQYLATLTLAQQQEVRASLAKSGSTLQMWFQAAVDAGVPDAVRLAGGQPTEGGGGVALPAGGKTSDWLGKRKPTPSELRQFAQERGQSEDYARFDDRQLAAWIANAWDVGANAFRSYHAPKGAQGNWVYAEKPTESVTDPQGTEWGPWGDQMGVNVTEKKQQAAAQQIAAQGGGGWGGTYAPPEEENFNPYDPLQARLMELFGGQGGYFADTHPTFGRVTPGGGLIWGEQGNPWEGPGGTALAKAAMTAFGPAAPSQQVTAPPKAAWREAGGGVPKPVAYPTSPVAAPVKMPAVAPAAVPRAAPITSPLESAIARRYANPNRWWAGQ